jgi:hypothetical protein
MIKTLVFLSMALGISVSIKAQNDTAIIYSRPEVVVFHSHSPAQQYQDPEPYVGIYHLNALKINPINIFIGDFPFYLERRLKNNFTFEIGVGVTSANYLREIFVEPYQPELKKQSMIGYSFSGAVRYYPLELLNGFFIGPEVRVRNYTNKIISCGDVPVLDANKERRNVMDFKAQFGYIFYLEGNMFVELYAGTGIRAVEGLTAMCNQTANPNTGRIEYELKFNKEEYSSPAAALGFKIGATF